MTITTSPRTTTVPRSRNVPLIAARTLAGVIGLFQVVGVLYFAVIAPEEAIWLGLWIDVPVLAVLFSSILLKLATAFLPGLTEHRRIRLGFLAVACGVAATALKVSLYDEPEGLTMLAVDAVLLLFLVLGARTARNNLAT